MGKNGSVKHIVMPIRMQEDQKYFGQVKKETARMAVVMVHVNQLQWQLVETASKKELNSAMMGMPIIMIAVIMVVSIACVLF